MLNWCIGLLVYLHDQTGYTTNNYLYHVGSPVMRSKMKLFWIKENFQVILHGK